LSEVECPKFRPMQSFGVAQDDKLRTCINEIFRNEHSDTQEKMRLLAHKTILHFVEMATLGTTDISPPFQSKSDVTHDIAQEVRETIKTEKVTTFPNSIPSISKIDFKSAYRQIGIRSPEENVIAVFDVDADKYRFYESKVMTFGNLHSIVGFVAIAETLMAIIWEVFRIPATIFIDDTITFTRHEDNARCHALIKKLYRAIGLRMSPKEQHCDSHVKVPSLKVLGLQYVREVDSLQVTIPEAKKVKLRKYASVVMSKVGPNTISLNDLEKVTGMSIFILSLRRWKQELTEIYPIFGYLHFFSDLAHNRNMRYALKKQIQDIVSLCDTLPPVKFALRAKKRKATVFSDANLLRLGGLVMSGTKAFVVSKEFKCPNIEWNELRAVDFVILSNQKLLRERDVTWFVDNQGDLYHLVRGTAKDPTSRLILKQILAKLSSLNCGVYWVYINSKRNLADPTTRPILLDKLRETLLTLNLTIFYNGRKGVWPTLQEAKGSGHPEKDSNEEKSANIETRHASKPNHCSFCDTGYACLVYTCKQTDAFKHPDLLPHDRQPYHV
jgi:hypothetical protein